MAAEDRLGMTLELGRERLQQVIALRADESQALVEAAIEDGMAKIQDHIRIQVDDALRQAVSSQINKFFWSEEGRELVRDLIVKALTSELDPAPKERKGGPPRQDAPERKG